MDRVLDRLWIGNSTDLEPGFHLRSLGFCAVLDLRDVSTAGASDVCIPRVVVHRVSNRDGDAWSAEDVKKAFLFIDEHLRLGKVLVACAAGMSRSPSMVIGYLVRSGWSAAEAYRHVRGARPTIAPVAAMLDSVLRVVSRNFDDVANLVEALRADREEMAEKQSKDKTAARRAGAKAKAKAKP